MKKSKLALAVAGAMTAGFRAPVTAQADAALYGSLRPKLRPAQPQYWDWRQVSKDMNRRKQ
ncbi:hypothetical protein SAMN05421647_102440 [Marinobacterium stanieri]|uniref:Uncharacterized protein n=1 Tax=Marinobacterium stanieri TaxID=49186 RepID=A0A1N6QE07_9GAMM|nr:hypothetical protein SAMN05421647_102440 [Marinobacterium stanieri]